MSDEAPAVVAKKRRGRPPKKRHDVDDAPITGAGSEERVANKQPGYEYMWVSEDDLPEMHYRGAEVCKRDTEQARPYFDLRKDTGEANLKFKGLTLMKIKSELHAKAHARGLAIAQQRSSSLRKNATSQVGSGQFASISQHEYGRQAI